jgi:hypothetical protein
MTRSRSRQSMAVAGVVASALAVASCGVGAQVWTGPDGTVTAEPGSRHCGTESALFLVLGDKQYVFDPGSTIEHRFLVSKPEQDAELPADAVDTGLRRSAAHLWLAADGNAPYVVAGDTVQKWPRATQRLGCD